MIAAVLYASAACLFVGGIGLAIGVVVHEIRESRVDRDAPDFNLDLENNHENE